MNIRDFLRSQVLPLSLINKFLPKSGKIIEIGCGEGVIAKHVAKEKRREVIGIDKDEKRLPKDKNENLKFIVADIRRYDFPKAKGFILSDVLHHLPKRDQRDLLVKISSKLGKKGVLIIKEIDTSEFTRSKLSRVWDYILYPRDEINYWQYKDLKKYLEHLKFKIKILRPNRFFPGSTTLFIAKNG